MDIFKPAMDLIQALSGLAGMLSAYFAYRSDKREIREDEARGVLKQGDLALRAPVSTTAFKLLAEVISPKILDAAKKNIDRAEDRFGSAIADIRLTPQAKDQEAQVARAEVCSLLQLIKDHNEDKLPDEALDRMWRQFRCTDATAC